MSYFRTQHVQVCHLYPSGAIILQKTASGLVYNAHNLLRNLRFLFLTGLVVGTQAIINELAKALVSNVILVALASSKQDIVAARHADTSHG